MWKEKKFVDAEVHCNGEVFRVHRSVLAASSTVFEAMFATEGMKEGNSRVVSIPRSPARIVEMLLKFMYDGEFLASVDDCLELLVLADQHQVNGLIAMCCECFIHSFSKEAAISILRVLQPRRHVPAVARTWEMLAVQLENDGRMLRAVLDQM